MANVNYMDSLTRSFCMLPGNPQSAQKSVVLWLGGYWYGTLVWHINSPRRVSSSTQTFWVIPVFPFDALDTLVPDQPGQMMANVFIWDAKVLR